jgi:pSer/pThr/pTyr-binding forkhead associated (FHA) protein
LRTPTGERLPVKRAVASIGRLRENDIVLTDTKVSRRHAMIIDTGIVFVIHDTGSANGVLVNGEKIVGSAALADGDPIRIGNSEFIFELQADGDEQAAGT